MHTAALLRPQGVVAASELPAAPNTETWAFDALAGRFIELSGAEASAALTASAALIAEVQHRGGAAVWIGGCSSIFFPPDLAASGIDVEALPVIRVPDEKKLWQIADTLLRSGAFALAMIDLGPKATLPLPVQTRLVGLAKKYNAVLLVLSRKAREENAAGSLVSLRGESEKHRADHDCFVCDLRAVKDKRSNPGWHHTEICRGQEGLC